MQTFTSVRIPQLTSRYSVQNDGFSLGTPLGVGGGLQVPQREGDALHVHVQGVNAVIRL